MEFQSTLSSRRATNGIVQTRRNRNISIHALLTESDPYDPLVSIEAVISIHALLAESDLAVQSVSR